jgi:hypothetical protein
MNAVRLGLETLTAAEARLKELAADAIAADEWDAVPMLAQWAKGVRALIDRRTDGSPAAADSSREGGLEGRSVERHDLSTKVAEKPAPAVSSKAGSAPPETRKGKPAGKNRKQGAPTKKYPVFFRQSENLVKVGWSKKARREYQHQAPKRVLEKLVATVLAVSAKSPQFTIEQVLPLMSERDGVEMPGYQTYLCVAWLRDAGLLEQHGRQGYSIRQRDKFQDATEDAWNLLPRNG